MIKRRINMNKLKLGLVSLFSVLALGGAVALVPSPAHAASCTDPVACIQQGVDKTGGKNATPVETRIKTIVNMILYILGAIAVIMIVIGGVRYTTSGGDAGGVSGAKNTILYAVVGLVIAIMAYAIVNFVLDSFAK
jgi:hypothetical protein